MQLFLLATRARIVLAAAVAACAVSAGSAQAAQLDLTGGTLTYRGDPGEPNLVHMVPTDVASCAPSGGCELFHYNAAGPHLGIYTYNHETRGDLPIRRTNEAVNCQPGRNPGVEFFCPLSRVSRIVVEGGDRDDLIDTLGALPATINGGDGKDNVRGSVSNDAISGGPGNDKIISDGMDWFARVPTGGGYDRVFGGSGGDDIFGGPSHDNLSGDSENDRLVGEDGDDHIRPGLGADSIDGGAGLDAVDYSERGARVIVRLPNGDGGAGGQGEVGEFDALRLIEDIHGGRGPDLLVANDSPARNQVFGGDGNDAIYGRGGPDILWGHDGDDTIDGGSGEDALHGVEGNDWLYSADSEPDNDFCGAGKDSLVADKSGDKRFECESVKVAMNLPKSVTVSGRATSVRLPVRCFAIPPATCSGTMDFYITPPVLPARTRKVRVAHKRFKVRAGSRRAIRLKLSRRARRALRRRGRLRVSARARIRIDGGPRVVVRRSIMLKRRR